MNNKRKYDNTSDENVIIKQPRQTITCTEIKVEEATLLDSSTNNIDIENDFLYETSTTGNNVSFYNEAEELILSSETGNAMEDPIDEININNYKLDEIKIEETVINNPTISPVVDFERYNVSFSELYSPDQIKIERSTTPTSPIAYIDNDKIENVPISETCKPDVKMKIEETTIASCSVEKYNSNGQSFIINADSLIGESCKPDVKIEIEETTMASCSVEKYNSNGQSFVINADSLIGNTQASSTLPTSFSHSTHHACELQCHQQSVGANEVNKRHTTSSESPTTSPTTTTTNTTTDIMSDVASQQQTATAPTTKGAAAASGAASSGGVKKAKNPRLIPTYPHISEMVNGAIKSLKERRGSSLYAIKKYVAAKYKVDAEKMSPVLKKYLKAAVASGALVQTKGKGASGSFKLAQGPTKKPKSETCKPNVKMKIEETRIASCSVEKYNSNGQSFVINADSLIGEICVPGDEIKIEETIIASCPTEKDNSNVQHLIMTVNTLFGNDFGEIDIDLMTNNDAAEYINIANSSNRYLYPKEGLYFIESNPQHKDFIQITSSYECLNLNLRAWKTLPRSMLDVKSFPGHKGGVFAIKPILRGVRLGPHEMTTNKKLSRDCHSWLIVNGRLKYEPRLSKSNWTIFVNYTKDKDKQNLTLSQHEGVLYFRATKDINAGEELLVNYDGILTVKMNEKEEMCIPYIEDTLTNIYICRLCHLGFKLKEHLENHNCEKAEDVPESELWSCTFCNVFICQKRYKINHEDMCEGDIFPNGYYRILMSNRSQSNDESGNSSYYTSTMNAMHRNIDPKVDLYCIESDPLYEDFVQITSCYKFRGRKLTCKPARTLPTSMLALKAMNGHAGGVFALRPIPKGVRLGPIEMTTNIKLRENCFAWKIFSGRLYYSPLTVSNWTLFVNYTQNLDKQNLTLTQNDGALYFRTVKAIAIDDELLVNYDNIEIIKVNQHEEMCVPYVETILRKIHTCRVCYLGFKWDSQLHNHTCLKPKMELDADLFICQHCNLFVCEKKYMNYHLELCRQISRNHVILSKPNQDDDQNDNPNVSVDPGVYINTVNTMNQYIDPKVGLYCVESNTDYKDFIHITSSYKYSSLKTYRPWRSLPRSMLTVKAMEGHMGGVFAVRPIFAGVRLGPIEMTTNTKLSHNCYAWKIADERLSYHPRFTLSNWTIFVNYTQNHYKQNLTITQHDGALYFRTVKWIAIDEELLVNYDDILTIKMNGHEEMCVPFVEHTLAKTHICRLCHLGFKYEDHLNSHVCIEPEIISDTDLFSCGICNLFMAESKYQHYHFELCSKNLTTRKEHRTSKEIMGYVNNNKKTYVNKLNSLNPYVASLKLNYSIESAPVYNIRSSSACDSERNGGGDYRPWKTLPRSYISVKALNYNKGGVFALRAIPKGVRIGPIDGAINIKLKKCYGWRTENGRLLYVRELSKSNWARFVNYTAHKMAHNLTITQCMGSMFFRTIKYIKDGHELLVNYDNILTVNCQEETYCVPFIETAFRRSYTCNQCNLDFHTENLLNIHICSEIVDVSDNDLWICDVCKSFVCELKYKIYHEKYCSLNSEQKKEIIEIKTDPFTNLNFIHISSINTMPSAKKLKAWLILPPTVFTSPIHGNSGVFATKKITEGVTMGPYTGIVEKHIANKYCYLIVNGNFKTNDDCDDNWLGAITVTPSKTTLNLVPFQFGGHLFFVAVKDIEIGEELRVFLNAEILEIDGKTYYMPPVRETMSTSYNCTCMLGFKSEESLIVHQLTCMASECRLKRLHEAFCTNLQKCQNCDIRTCNCGENMENHKKQCLEIIARKSSQEEHEENDISEQSNQMDQQIIKIQMTSDKDYYKCGYCCFKAPKLDDVYEHTKGHDKWKIYRKSNGLIVLYTCRFCQKNLRTPSDLTHHYEKHVLELPYGCRFCYFRTTGSNMMKNHIDGTHVVGWIEDADKTKEIALSLSSSTVIDLSDSETELIEKDKNNLVDEDKNNGHIENGNEGKLIKNSRKYRNCTMGCNVYSSEKINSLNPYLQGPNSINYIEDNLSYTGSVFVSSNYKQARNTNFKPWKLLNRSVLAIKASNNHKGGVFAIRRIPVGVRLGPIEGVINEKIQFCCAWKLENEKLFFIPLLHHSSWARFVNYTKNIEEQNLTITQRQGLLYFRTVMNIEINQELLVNYDNILTVYLRGQEYCVPFIETRCWIISMCDRCNLGFKSPALLKQHCCTKPIDVPDLELWTCQICNSFVCEKIYKENHWFNCLTDRSQASTDKKQCDSTNTLMKSRKFNNALVHIYCNDVSLGIRDRQKKTLPSHLLTLDFRNNNVTTLINIREGVTMGPYDGLIKRKLSKKCGFLFENGNFVKNHNNLNWLSYVNVTQCPDRINLITVQHKGYLFFETIKDVEVGQNLLVYLNSEIQELDGKRYYVPRVREHMISSYLCSCMQGFRSEDSLIIHKLTCIIPRDRPISLDVPPKSASNVSVLDVQICAYCDTFSCSVTKIMVEHEKRCSEKIIREVMTNEKEASIYDSEDDDEDEEGRCKICNKKYINLDLHIILAHMTVNYYNCQKCSFRNLALNSLYEHIKGHEKWEIIPKETSSTVDYKCKLCGDTFTEAYRSTYEVPSTLQLQNHSLKHIVDLPYACHFCFYRSNVRDVMENHIAANHTDGDHKRTEIDLSLSASTTYLNKQKQCKICNKYHTDIGMHVRDKHINNIIFKCLECSYKVSDILTFQNHMQDEHKKEKMNDADHQHIKKKDSMHVRDKHINNKIFKCLKCSYKVGDILKFQNHMRDKHKKEKMNDADNQHIKKKNSMHVRDKHINNKKFKCLQCSYKVSNILKLQNHMRDKHKKEKMNDADDQHIKEKDSMNLLSKPSTSIRRHINILKKDLRINEKAKLHEHLVNEKSKSETTLENQQIESAIIIEEKEEDIEKIW